MNSATTLSKKEYWDEVLKKASLPRKNSYKSYGYSVTMDYVHEILIGNEGKTFLEIGCGSSGWLPYFQQEYDLRISGLDYSDVGCEIARKNLNMQEIPFDEIYCKDFLDKDFFVPQQFDFIFSYGVVEHFSDTTQIIKIFKKLLAPGGKIITLIPNLKGWNGFITRNMMREIFDLHRVLDNHDLKSFHVDSGLQIIKSNYVGTFCLGVLPFANSENWLFRRGTKRRDLSLKLISFADTVLSIFLKRFNLKLPTKMFSPYIICIAKHEPGQ